MACSVNVLELEALGRGVAPAKTIGGECWVGEGTRALGEAVGTGEWTARWVRVWGVGVPRVGC